MLLYWRREHKQGLVLHVLRCRRVFFEPQITRSRYVKLIAKNAFESLT